MMLKRIDVPLQVKTVNDDGTFTGYGSVFGVKDHHGDIVMKGAFMRSLAAHKEKNTMPACLYQHNSDEPIGIYTLMQEDDHGLKVEAKLAYKDVQRAKESHALLKMGAISGLSIGYRFFSDDSYRYNNDFDVYELLEIDLQELSLVTFPSNESARVETVKSMVKDGDLPPHSYYERALRDALGLSKTQAKRFMHEGISGIAKPNNRDLELLAGLQALSEKINSNMGRA